MKKIFKLFIFMFIAFVTCMFDVKAETSPDTIVVDTNGEYYQKTLYGREYLPTQGFSSTITSIRKKDTNNNILYCAQEVEKMPGKNTGQHTWNYKKVADNTDELSFVWENGYHGQANYSATNYLTGDADADYFLTGMAVWKYTQPASSLDLFGIDDNGNYDGTYSGYSNEVSQKIAKLINDAKGYKKNPSLKISITNTKLTLTEDKKYYISSPITFTINDLTSDINVTLSGINGAFATSDKNATSGVTSFAQDSTIYIKVPVSNMSTSATLKMNASAKGIKYVAYIYEHSSNPNGYQLLTKFEEEEISAEDIKNFTTDKIEIVISKKDITGSKEVTGATLVIKKDNTEVLKWVSDGTEKMVSLDTGEYTLEETIAPEGYKLNTEKITFKVNANGTVTVGGTVVDKVVMKNTPFYVMISKLGIDKDKQLEGVTLKITDKEGKLDKDLDGKSLTWTSSSKEERFRLAPGSYILTEIEAPRGYELSDAVIEFTITEDGKILYDKQEADNNMIVFKNTPEPEQVQTGSTILYVLFVGIITAGVVTFIVYKRKND